MSSPHTPIPAPPLPRSGVSEVESLRRTTDAARSPLLSAACAFAVLATALPAPSFTEATDPRPEARTPSASASGVMAEPNPYLSFLPAGASPNYRYWQPWMAEKAKERRARMLRMAPTTATAPTGSAELAFDETEPNDEPDAANTITGFGTGPGEDGVADVSGSFPGVPAPSAIGPFDEDEGSITLASDTGLTTGRAVVVAGTIGDGPYGSSGTGTGDFDFYRIADVQVGQLIVVDVDTASPTGDLDPHLALYDASGRVMKLNEDEEAGVNNDPFMAVSAPQAGDYYVSVSGSLSPFVSILVDPFDSSTGRGIESEGDYTLTMRLEQGDRDWFEFELEACDILGVRLDGLGQQVLLRDPDGEILTASSQDLSFAYPESSPLPGGGRAVLAHAATRSGTYALRVLGFEAGDYTLALRAFRPPTESAAIEKTLFVDFDGATFERSIFIGAPEGEVTLSPMRTFLDEWGLTLGDENAVIDAILATLEENVATDPHQGGPGHPGVLLRNSRDHADPFGQPGVSRLIIGGSIGELQLPTIGIAQSIDPGNFGSEETAVILLDQLSDDPANPDSLNGFARADGVSMIELIGVAVGNIAAHEAGHYTGSFHTERRSVQPSLMDQGGDLPNTVGLGPDGIFGNADDVDVDFGHDTFVHTEGFAGTEDTLTVFACGCADAAPAGAIFRDGFEAGDISRWPDHTP